jgi:hypothetical protein
VKGDDARNTVENAIGTSGFTDALEGEGYKRDEQTVNSQEVCQRLRNHYNGVNSFISNGL